MPRYIAFLRAVNIGGRSIKMEPLRRLFESLGFLKVATYIASGNVVFETTNGNAKSLEEEIEKRLRDALRYEVATFIRTDAELAEVATFKPFPHSKIDAATESYIVFLHDTLDEMFTQKVRSLRTETDEFAVHGREIYWLRRKKQSGLPFSTVPLGKSLGRSFTVRSSKTVQKMAEKYSTCELLI